MAKRDLSVSLCGVVLGLILGAGSVAFVQGPTLAANTLASSDKNIDVRFHEAPKPVDFVRRRVDGRGIPLYRDIDIPNRFPTIVKDETDVPTTATTQETGPVTTCDAVRKTVAKIRAVVSWAVPDTIKNTEIRLRLMAVLDDANDDYCDGSAAAPVTETISTSSASAPSAAKNCDKYGTGTIRRTLCKMGVQ